MPPVNYSNFIFNLRHFQTIFHDLQFSKPNDYKFIINLITHGVDIKRSTTKPSKSAPNYPIKPKVIKPTTIKLLNHLALGQIAGPFDLIQHPDLFDKVHTSPLSIKLKHSGKPMVLIDQSSPEGDSINSEIDQASKNVFYVTFLMLCALLQRIGVNGWFWIIDAVDAYYRIPINKDYYHLFGIKWLSKLLIFKCLTFGLSTAPSIYTRFADLLQWACTHHKTKIFQFKNSFNILHYLDDFFGGNKKYTIAKLQMDYLTWLFKFLNIPTNPSKVVGPTQLADILGWSCCTISFISIGLAERKRVKYIVLIEHLIKVVRINFFQSEKIIGYLRHSCQVYLLGNKFIRGIEKQKHCL